MTDATQPSALRAVIGNRYGQVLAAIAAVVAIVGEGAIVCTNIQKSQIETETTGNAQERPKAEAEIARISIAKAKSDADKAASGAAILKALPNPERLRATTPHATTIAR
jgi:hypothetical protein